MMDAMAIHPTNLRGRGLAERLGRSGTAGAEGHAGWTRTTLAAMITASSPLHRHHPQ